MNDVWIDFSFISAVIVFPEHATLKIGSVKAHYKSNVCQIRIKYSRALVIISIIDLLLFDFIDHPTLLPTPVPSPSPSILPTAIQSLPPTAHPSMSQVPTGWVELHSLFQILSSNITLTYLELYRNIRIVRIIQNRHGFTPCLCLSKICIYFDSKQFGGVGGDPFLLEGSASHKGVRFF